MHYTILTAKQAHAVSSKFRVPDKGAVNMLQSGNMVLVMVDFINSHTGRPQAEPIWCVVLRREKDKLVVAAWDTPPPKKSMHHGIGAKTLLNIKLCNVIDIMFEAPKTEHKII